MPVVPGASAASSRLTVSPVAADMADVLAHQCGGTGNVSGEDQVNKLLMLMRRGRQLPPVGEHMEAIEPTARPQLADHLDKVGVARQCE